jgi:hypothetical protein
VIFGCAQFVALQQREKTEPFMLIVAIRISPCDKELHRIAQPEAATGLRFDKGFLLQIPDHFAIAPRLEASFDLSPTQTILGGVSAAFGPNDTGDNCCTQIYGADLFYKWKPANAEGGWPFVKWQSEAMFRRYEAGQGLNNSFPAAETFHD